MSRISIAQPAGFVKRALFPRLAEVPAPGVLVTHVPWRRLAKLAIGGALLAIAAVTAYQHVIVRVSREAVINARIVSIRAPMDGIIRAAASAPGATVRAGAAFGQIEDPTADDARVFQLGLDLRATERERHAQSRRVADLQRAKSEATAQAEAYQTGRVRQVELRIEEARANLAAARAREVEALDAEKRGNALRGHGYIAEAAYERLFHAREVAQQDSTATQKRLDTLAVELEAARTGTYLGDNYNDVPSSFQRARELTVRIDEIAASFDESKQKEDMLAAQLAAEQNRFEARSSAALASPIDGNLWTVQAASGEFVRKGQELFSVIDCSTVVVTASVSDRDYNELRLGEPVRFRVAGTGREYHGNITKLGLTSTGRSFAIPPEERHHQVAVQLADLEQNANDGCAVGRTGEVVFEGQGRGLSARLVESVRHLLGIA
jgi:multidrug resistance efflux pump